MSRNVHQLGEVGGYKPIVYSKGNLTLEEGSKFFKGVLMLISMET